MQAKWVYSDIVKEHFMNPKNVLDEKEGFREDGKGLVGNIKCGDQMIFVIKVDKGRGVITDCRWQTYGCASAIASTSILSEAVKGMSIEDAYHVSPKDIAERLGGLPEHKIHCSVLGDKALRAAIDDYYARKGIKEGLKNTTAHVVCKCMNVTDSEIEQAVIDGAKTYYELQERTKLGTVCGGCKDEAEALLAEYIKKHSGL